MVAQLIHAAVESIENTASVVAGQMSRVVAQDAESELEAVRFEAKLSVEPELEPEAVQIEVKLSVEPEPEAVRIAVAVILSAPREPEAVV